MTAEDQARTPTALETVEALKRDLVINTPCTPRYVYLGDAAHDTVLKCLQGIYAGTQSMKRLVEPPEPDKPVRLIQVAGLKVRRHHLPWAILVTVGKL